MSLAEQNPTEERTVVNLGGLPLTADVGNPWRGFIADADGTATIQFTAREASPVTVIVTKGWNPHKFNNLTAVTGITAMTAYR